ncbi:MAG: haloacid dehalogenase-like hydrolase [Pseudomonadota bacterium]
MSAVETGAVAPFAWRPPDETLQTLKQRQGASVLVDLDNTLLCGNTLDAFLDQAWPRPASRLLVLLARFLNGLMGNKQAANLDRWIFLLVGLLLPWSLPRWRIWGAAHAARKYGNAALLAALAGHRNVVCSYAFQPLARPLVSHLLPMAEIVACGVFGSDRQTEKDVLIRRRIADREFDIAITDSLRDASMLALARDAHLVRWFDADFAHAWRSAYVPLYYLERIRRPGERSFLRSAVQDDLCLAVILCWSFPQPGWIFVAGQLLLFLSFWCVYEQGYVDNDHIAVRFEPDNPRPSTRAQQVYGRPHLAAGLWAMALGAGGCSLLAIPLDVNWLQLLKIWFGALLIVVLAFGLYNRISPPSRIVLFPLLQLMRVAVLLLWTPLSLAGGLMLSAHVIVRQMQYVTYRHVDHAARVPVPNLLRLQLFLLLMVVMALAGAEGLLQDLGLIAMLLAWSVFRARREMSKAWISLSWVWRRGGR